MPMRESPTHVMHDLALPSDREPTSLAQPQVSQFPGMHPKYHISICHTPWGNAYPTLKTTALNNYISTFIILSDDPTFVWVLQWRRRRAEGLNCQLTPRSDGYARS
ncbi:hypothetical protein CEXT_315661 [Caerostris extrusa]|uniref:Uncharacterized protein n=1 Tax=Caerostris extrusa TaxID=172846 RepID=A0AAV4PBT2_CAEEX|nr:hypothetical protein CEXT_315661 [Caerostris extrusa]